MTDRELMQQALEALEDACGGRCNAENNPCWQRDVANALRERLAQPQRTHWEGCEEVHPECKETRRRATLVAAAEREKVAAWMINRSYATGHGDAVEDLLKELDWQIRESEREACAAIAETPVTGEQDDITMEAKDRVAAAIRARGDKPCN